MDCASRIIILTFLLALNVGCVAQASEASSETIMDAAFDLQKAAKLADSLTAGGAKYCHGGRPRIDFSDLDEAISRHLLNHASHVPEHINVADMWRVSFVAADLLRQLELLGDSCLASRVSSREAESLYRDCLSYEDRFRDALNSFQQIAASETLSREQRNLSSIVAAEKAKNERVRGDLQSILLALREMEESAKTAGELSSQGFRKKSDCFDDQLPSFDIQSLSSLASQIGSQPNQHFLSAGEMIAVQLDSQSFEMIVTLAERLCVQRAAEKKKASKAAIELDKAHMHLVRSIVTFEPLFVRQAEWEESVVQEEGVGEIH